MVDLLKLQQEWETVVLSHTPKVMLIMADENKNAVTTGSQHISIPRLQSQPNQPHIVLRAPKIYFHDILKHRKGNHVLA